MLANARFITAAGVLRHVIIEFSGLEIHKCKIDEFGKQNRMSWVSDKKIGSS